MRRTRAIWDMQKIQLIIREERHRELHLSATLVIGTPIYSCYAIAGNPMIERRTSR